MCILISLLTKGKTGGCAGVCPLCSHFSSIVILFAGLIWNFVHGRLFKRREKK